MAKWQRRWWNRISGSLQASEELKISWHFQTHAFLTKFTHWVELYHPGNIYYSLYFWLFFSSNCWLWNQKFHQSKLRISPTLVLSAMQSNLTQNGLSWLARAFSWGSWDLRGVELFHEQHCSLWKPTQQILSGSYTMLIITITIIWDTSALVE